MERDFYPKRLNAAGIGVLVPERTSVSSSPDDPRAAGEVGRSPSSRDGFLAIMRARGAGDQGIVLGCTEIPLVVEPDQSPVPAFDPTRIHALAAVDFALSA